MTPPQQSAIIRTPSTPGSFLFLGQDDFDIVDNEDALLTGDSKEDSMSKKKELKKKKKVVKIAGEVNTGYIKREAGNFRKLNTVSTTRIKNP
jgi:hypothetical protein